MSFLSTTLHCEKIAEIRNKHPEALHTLKEICPQWICLPLARQHRDITLLRSIFRARKIPKPVKLHTTYHQGLPHYKCFTDGSCILPTDHTCRRSSWAVNQDIANSDSQRSHQVSSITNLNESLQIPNLQCVMISPTHGVQSAARSELCASVFSCQCVFHTDPQESAAFYTDSQYVYDVISTPPLALTNFPIHKMASYDLVKLLVKDLLHMVANHLADRAAAKTLEGEFVEIKQLSETIFRFHQTEFKRLREVLRFYADLNFEKIRLSKLENNNICGGSSNKNQKNLVEDVFENSYNILQPWSFENFEYIQIDDLSPYVAHASGSGGNTTTQVWKWLKLIQWPVGRTLDHEHDPGISWFEMVVNSCICVQQHLPIQVSCEGRFVTYPPYESESAELQPVSCKTANMQASTSYEV